MTLSSNITDKIKQDANTYSEDFAYRLYDESRISAYTAGATTWAEWSEKMNQCLKHVYRKEGFGFVKDVLDDYNRFINNENVKEDEH